MHLQSVRPHVPVIPIIASYPPAVTVLGKFQMVSMVLEADSKGCSVCAWERAAKCGQCPTVGGGGEGQVQSTDERRQSERCHGKVTRRVGDWCFCSCLLIKSKGLVFVLGKMESPGSRLN